MRLRTRGYLNVVIVASCAALAGDAQDGRTAGSVDATNQTFARQSAGYELNEGQTDPAVRFYFRGPAGTVFLTETQAVLTLSANGRGAAVQMNFVGANPAPRVEGVDRLPGQANYFIGRDPAKWRAHVPIYGKVRYDEIYPGVDLLFHRNHERLEHDFIVAPGADPAKIAMSFAGADVVRIDEDGDLRLEVSGGDIRLSRPVVYQSVDGARRPIDGRYLLLEPNDDSSGHPQVGFEIGPYDRARELVIDPVLIYSTYFGGSDNDRGTQIEVDDTGVYLFGQTASLDFPVAGEAFQPELAGGFDAFVSKFSLDGTMLLYSTYVGGSANEDPFVATGFAVDKHGNAIIGSRTASLDFPLVEPFQSTYGGGTTDGFITKLSADGSSLLYSSYLGGSGADQVELVAVDSAGHAYLSGMTTSTDFPTRKPFQATYGGGPADAFVTKVHVHGKKLLYSTYLGGAGRDDFTAIAVDSDGQAHVSGRTSSIDFPTVAPLQAGYGGGQFDVFLTKFAEDGQSLIFSTYLGGTGRDEDRNIAVDANGDVYVVGVTASSNFPTLSPLQPLNAGGAFDGFVLKLVADGSALIFSTYLGGSGDDRVITISVADGGNPVLGGVTSSTNFPTVSPLQALFGGGPFDGHVVEMSRTGDQLLFSTYLGGSGEDRTTDVEVGAGGAAYVIGLTSSTNFPTANAFQPTNAGGFDAWLAKIGW